jgi:uncharacterized membrane protein YdjX (TVP38/TMEM64 family)
LPRFSRNVALLLAVLLLALLLLAASGHVTLDALQGLIAVARAHYQSDPLATIAVYCLVYIVAAGISLPGSGLLTVVGGVLFGTALGVMFASFASTLGAVLAFLSARWLLRDLVQARLARHMHAVNRALRRDGALLLFSLRLVPAIPVFVINLVMGLTPIRTWTFCWVSQLSMLPATVIYAKAGAELGRLDAGAGMMTPSLVVALTLLAAFPWIARGIVRLVRRIAAQRGIVPAHTELAPPPPHAPERNAG